MGCSPGRPTNWNWLAYRVSGGWCDACSADINADLREISGIDISARIFRAWNGIVLAGATLADRAPGEVGDGAPEAVVAMMREIVEYRGNTPTVARRSYVDSRVVDLYHTTV